MINCKQYLHILSRCSEKKDPEQGFSIIEALVAIITLSLAFIINLQLLAALQIRNIKQEIDTAAVSVSKEIMDDIRYRLQNNLSTNYPQGLSQLTGIDRSGYDFNADVYVCAGQAVVNTDQSVTCPGTGGQDIRYIVVQVIYGATNEKIYTVQSTFTRLR